MKLKDEFEKLPKSEIYYMYCAIVYNPKDYENITRTKMLEEIIEEESKEKYIYYMVTERELKFLMAIQNGDVKINELEKYSWEMKELNNKCIFSLISFDIFDEQKENVKKAINLYTKNKDLKRNNDTFFSILIGIVRTEGSMLTATLKEAITGIFQVENNFNSLLANPLVHYYCDFDYKYIRSFDDEKEEIYYRKYYDLLDELDSARKEFGMAGAIPFNLDEYKEMFYNGFPVSKPSVKKMFEKLNMNKYDITTYYIEEARVLNSRFLVDAFNQNNEIRKIIYDALDDTPCAAMNGFTPNEREKELKKEEKLNTKFARIKQHGANLSTQDSELFYKLYFALLEYTNNKYHLEPKLKKIYNQKFINAELLVSINDYLFENKKIISDFIKDNPYNFTKQELSIVKGFEHSIICNNYMIVGFEKEYTKIFDGRSKIYMVKGIRDNLDNVIGDYKLPVIIDTTLLMYKDNIVFNSFLSRSELIFGNDVREQIAKEVAKAEKFFHID